VDYEHWYISLYRMYQIHPNLKGWMADLKERYDVLDVTFFADFSNQHLANEVPRIREITNNIIFTAPTGTGAHKKDFTDFIMLDHLYQRAMSAKDIDTFIIFSGDGHFSSVVSFLKNTMDKEVGIYGVKDALSNQLRNIASWVNTVPSEDDIYKPYYQAIFELLSRKEAFKLSAQEVVNQSVAKTKLSKEIAHNAVDRLISNGYLQLKKVHTDRSKIKVFTAVFAAWDKVKADGLYVPPVTQDDEVTRLRRMLKAK
jgi:uncharacterized LabA/DUF88 family protein